MLTQGVASSNHIRNPPQRSLTLKAIFIVYAPVAGSVQGRALTIGMRLISGETRECARYFAHLQIHAECPTEAISPQIAQSFHTLPSMMVRHHWHRRAQRIRSRDGGAVRDLDNASSGRLGDAQCLTRQ